jgi:hypothetical protein
LILRYEDTPDVRWPSASRGQYFEHSETCRAPICAFPNAVEDRLALPTEPIKKSLANGPGHWETVMCQVESFIFNN